MQSFDLNGACPERAMRNTVSGSDNIVLVCVADVAQTWGISTADQEGSLRAPGTDPGFGSGRSSGVLTPRGDLSPKFTQNRVFPLKLPENCII